MKVNRECSYFRLCKLPYVIVLSRGKKSLLCMRLHVLLLTSFTVCAFAVYAFNKNKKIKNELGNIVYSL